MNIAIILSGGTGSRIGADIPKQYLEMNGKPVIKYCMDTIISCKEIDLVQVVADEQWMDLISDCIEPGYKNKLSGYSMPGDNRQLSIYNALCDLEGKVESSARILIHDAARPFVKKHTIIELLSALDESDGAIPVLPMKDTVYIAKDGKIDSLLDRSTVKAGQAPEAFVFDKYIEANRLLLPDRIRSINGSTEVAYLAGMSIKCIEGDEGNYKITTKDDLIRWQNESL